MLKKKWLGYAGERYRGFKTQLTHEYIKYPSDNSEPPYVKYSFIDKKFWEDFVKSRTTLDFFG